MMPPRAPSGEAGTVVIRNVLGLPLPRRLSRSTGPSETSFTGSQQCDPCPLPLSVAAMLPIFT